MAKRPYYYKAQLLDAIPYLESSRPSRALCVLQTTDGVSAVQIIPGFI